MKIAFLGLGKMGRAMAGHLLSAGHELTVWNRTPERAAELAAKGARVAATAAEAIREAEVVVSMMFNDAAYEEVFFGTENLAASFHRGQLHILTATLSAPFCERLAAVHAADGVEFVAAPVFGRPSVAEAGKLWIIAAGTEAAIERARPVFAPFSRGISVVGTEPAQAEAVKFGGNFLICSMIHALGESFVYAERQGIDPGAFFEAINSALFQSAFYSLYAGVMLDPPETPGATVELGAKDLGLMQQVAAAHGTRVSLAETLQQIFAEAKAQGLGEEDWAVAQYRLAQQRGAV